VGFLAPWFLAAAAAVGLPFWLHLLRQHRSTPRPFSSLMFFERRVESSILHRRLRYLALLALRMGLLVMLALAFAKPFLTGRAAAPAAGRRLVVAAIDTSFSMREDDRMARARREASGVIARMRPGDQGAVLAFASHVAALASVTSDTAALNAAVASAAPGDFRSSLGELARALRSLTETSRMPLEVHLVSDMQKTSLPPGFADLQLAPGTQLAFHRVAEGRAPNWAVESVTAPRRLTAGKKERVQAVIAGYGTPRATRRASLVLNGRVLDTRSVDVPAGSRATVEFPALEAPYGFSRGEVRIDSADALAADDRYFFPVERAEPARVLFVHEARDTRSPLYFQSALEASPDSGLTLEPVTVEQAANLSPAGYAFVVLSDVATIPGPFEAALRRRVESGGAVLAALGPATAARHKVAALDLKILDSRYSGREGERFRLAAWADSAHPSIGANNSLEGVEFYQTVRLDPGTARVVARLSDQTPLIVEQAVGEGRALFIASTFDNISNDFPLHSSFVPFVEQTARYLAGAEDRLANRLVDSYLELRRGRARGAAVEVLDPRGRRALSLAESAAATNLALDEQGFYEVRRPDGHNELVAVNADRRESDLEPIPDETLALWQNTGQGRGVDAGTAAEAAGRRNLWWPAMVAVLLLALAESFLANRHLAFRKEDA
jgi:hypothetical protein